MSSIANKKYAVRVSYLGTNYAGWQRQNDVKSVQQCIEESLLKIGENCTVTGAGRTDAGVHAISQIASFSTRGNWETRKLLLAMNAHLPEDIRIMDVFSVDESFDARRSALWREYRYFVYHGSSCLAPLRPFVWWNRCFWDLEQVRTACRLLTGRHDFRAFCKAAECPENSVRTLLRVSCKRIGRMTMLQVRGEAFLNNMVRIIVGNLDRVGRGEVTAGWMRELLSGMNRIESGMTAPSSGLFFWRVGYPLGGIK
ncbi:MAG: tRNA pseudouridine(38-40) synthase TruA [Synergistaceae bacterium]|nr:tRNA pseudouridine(38-40) synthase TruA [Synergistaceae bacterium]